MLQLNFDVNFLQNAMNSHLLDLIAGFNRNFY